MKRLKSFRFLAVLLLACFSLWMAGCPAKNTPVTPPSYPVQQVYGVMTYSGSKAVVSSTNPLVINPGPAPTFNSNLYGVGTTITSNSVTYFVSPESRPFFVTVYLAAVTLPCDTSSSPRQGDPYCLFSSSCSSPTTYNGYGPGSDLFQNITFGDNCLMSGVSGTVNYTGSYNTSTYPIVVELFKDSGYTTLDSPGYEYMNCNDTGYNLESQLSTAYLEVFVSLNGTDTIATGDPYLRYGTVTPSPTLLVNLTFNNSTIY